MSETSFLNLYKLLSDAPDPYPLLDAAVDQTVKVAEARMLESELARLREENGELKRQVGEMGTVEEKRKKAEAKVESMEEKVRVGELASRRVQANCGVTDGRSDTGASHAKGKRAECRVRREDAQL